MSWSKFSDDCPNCRPAIAVVEEGEVVQKQLPDDDPRMAAVLHVWNNASTRQERKAYHAIMCCNSRLPSDLRLTRALCERMGKALADIVFKEQA